MIKHHNAPESKDTNPTSHATNAKTQMLLSGTQRTAGSFCPSPELFKVFTMTFTHLAQW